MNMWKKLSHATSFLIENEKLLFSNVRHKQLEVIKQKIKETCGADVNPCHT